MSHDSRAIANIFVERSHENGRRLSIMQLVKLVYIAHGWTLGYTAKPLIKDEVQAWRYGPVVPQVYNAFRGQGILIYDLASNIVGRTYRTKLNEDEQEIVDGVYKKYSLLSPFALSNITHRKGTPWYQYRGRNYGTIPEDAIREYYKRVVDGMKKDTENDDS